MAASQSQRSVLEFFSGIGGLHYALRRSGVQHRVLRAYDVDDSAVRTYRHNFPESKVITHSTHSPRGARVSSPSWTLLFLDTFRCS